MPEPTKPIVIEDLDLDFESIGDFGWDNAIRSRLLLYGVPLPQPMGGDEVNLIQERLGHSIPEKLTKFYQLFGALNLGYIRFMTATEIDLGTSVWFSDSLSEDDRMVLSDQLLVVDAGGSGNFVSFDFATEQCRYLCHDPASAPVAFASLDHLVHWALTGVFVGRYGWPDASVEKLVATYQSRFTSIL